MCAPGYYHLLPAWYDSMIIFSVGVQRQSLAWLIGTLTEVIKEVGGADTHPLEKNKTLKAVGCTDQKERASSRTKNSGGGKS